MLVAEIELVHPLDMLLCEHMECKAKRAPALDYERNTRDKQGIEQLSDEMKRRSPYKDNLEYMPIALCEQHAGNRKLLTLKNIR